MTVKVEHDVDYMATIQTVLALMQRGGGTLLAYDSKGPGGGNPCLVVEFPTRKAALDYLGKVYPDEDDYSIYMVR